MTAPVVPTQQDRDSAADYLDACGWDWGACGDIREGRIDHPVVQALASHRLAALEEAARVAEGELMLAHDGFDLTGFRGENGVARMIAGAIRSLKEPRL